MMRKYHRKWQTYDTINMSIGQGMVLINPLQLAVMASRLATGKRVVPRLLKSKPVVPQTQLAVDQDHLDFIRQRHGRRCRSRHRGRCQAAARRHPDGGKDRHRPDAQSERRRTRQLHGGELEASRPLAVHGLRPVQQSTLRGRRDCGAWRLRRGRRRAAGPRHLAVPLRQAEGDRRARGLRAEHRRPARGAARAQDGRVARRPTGCRRFPPSRHDHLRHHPAAARAAAVALDLPRRGDRLVRSDRALFGRRRLGAALGGQAGDRLPRSSSASRSPCRG